MFGVAAVIFVAVIVAIGVLIGVPVYHYFNPSDYSGEGSGSVIVTVHANDGASQIGATLLGDGVVASQRAFTDAASDNAKSRSIEAGSYRMRKHMSGEDAVSRLLDPSARVNADVVITEGETIFDAARRLSSAPVHSDLAERDGLRPGVVRCGGHQGPRGREGARAADGVHRERHTALT